MATPLTTLNNVKEWLQLSGTIPDALLARMIAAFSDAVAIYLSRDLGFQPYTLTLDGTGGSTMTMPVFPVVSVTSLKIDGLTIQALPLGGANGYFFTDSRIGLLSHRFTKGVQNVEVELVAGYTTIPADIEQAVIEWVADRYMARDRISVTSKSLAGESISFSQADIPNFVQKVLDNHKRVVPN